MLEVLHLGRFTDTALAAASQAHRGPRWCQSAVHRGGPPSPAVRARPHRSPSAHRTAATTSGPYVGGRGRATTLGRRPAPRAFLAWHPVVAHSSSRIRPLSALLARLYRVAIGCVVYRQRGHSYGGPAAPVAAASNLAPEQETR